MMTGLTNSSIYILLVLTSFFGARFVKSTDISQCKKLESESSLTRLNTYLFCEYDQTVRPTLNHKNATVIRFDLVPQFIQVDADKYTMDLHSWSPLSWKDVRLTWEPSQYADIKSIHVKSYEIWIPEIVSHSAGSVASDEMPWTNCWVYYNGDIYCVPADVYTIHCDADHTWWPYETMNCTTQFGSWTYSIDELQFIYMRNEIEGLLTSKQYARNLEWEVLRTYITEQVVSVKYHGNFSTKLMSYHTILRRHSSSFSATYVAPALGLVTITLLTLWLEPKSIERMLIANLNFVCHLLCIGNLLWRIPFTGSSRPRLMTFYETSFVLSTLALILTSILRHIQELTIDAPVWISSSTASLLRSKVGQILLVSILDPKLPAEIETDADDNTDLVSSTRKEVAWEYVTIIVGWIAFLTLLIVYLVILILYLPTSNSGDSFVLNS